MCEGSVGVCYFVCCMFQQMNTYSVQKGPRSVTSELCSTVGTFRRRLGRSKVQDPYYRSMDRTCPCTVDYRYLDWMASID